jgi:hypothetical protein
MLLIQILCFFGAFAGLLTLALMALRPAVCRRVPWFGHRTLGDYLEDPPSWVFPVAMLAVIICPLTLINIWFGMSVIAVIILGYCCPWLFDFVGVKQNPFRKTAWIETISPRLKHVVVASVVIFSIYELSPALAALLVLIVGLILWGATYWPETIDFFGKWNPARWWFGRLAGIVITLIGIVAFFRSMQLDLLFVTLLMIYSVLRYKSILNWLWKTTSSRADKKAI